MEKNKNLKKQDKYEWEIGEKYQNVDTDSKYVGKEKRFCNSQKKKKKKKNTSKKENSIKVAEILKEIILKNIILLITFGSKNGKYGKNFEKFLNLIDFRMISYGLWNTLIFVKFSEQFLKKFTKKILVPRILQKLHGNLKKVR